MPGVVMRFPIRNFYVFVFAFVSIISSVLVASHPDRAVQIARPLVEDAAELKKLAISAYVEIRDFNWRAARDEFVSLYVAVVRMPSLLFERLAERLDEFNDDLSKRADERSPAKAEHRQFEFASSL